MSMILVAALVGTISAGPGASVELHSDRGVCVGDARRAEYLSPTGNVSGCWKLIGDSVLMTFLDGDYAAVSVSAIKKAP